jgi:TPP-dependent pyruvate/acetoin dehydrogenase alpha subunit
VAGLAAACEAAQVAAALLGDGACDEGVLAESLNFAAIKKLPAIFLCENNRYSVYTPSRLRQAARPVEVAKTLGLAWLDVPIERASDVFALAEMLAGAIERVRQGGGPLFVECQTVRAMDHHGVRDDVAAGFRPEEEKRLFEAYDPLKVARCRMRPEVCGEIDADVAVQVEAAYQQALADAPAVWEARP